MKYSLQQVTSGIIIPILVIVVGVAAYIFLLPQYKDVRQQQGQLKQQEEESDSKSIVLQDLKNLASELEEKRAGLSQIDKAIPQSPEIPELLANIDYLVSQSGLLITSLQLSQAQTLSSAGSGQAVELFGRQEMLRSSTQNLGMMQIDLKVVGAYSTIKNFLLNIEQNQRLMDIQELIFEEPDGESGLQGFNLKILTYYQQQQTTVRNQEFERP